MGRPGHWSIENVSVNFTFVGRIFQALAFPGVRGSQEVADGEKGGRCEVQHRADVARVWGPHGRLCIR